MILSTQMPVDQLSRYSDPVGKILRMKRSGEIFPFTRSFYETDGNVPGYFPAVVIFGPSCLSLEYALAVYDLLPETEYTYTFVTFDKKKREVENYFGRFSYRDMPPDAYHFGILFREENGYIYWIAVSEKVLCDKLYTMSPDTSQREIERMLFEDLRIDSEEFAKFDVGSIFWIGDRYHSNKVKYLIKYLRNVSVRKA